MEIILLSKWYSGQKLNVLFPNYNISYILILQAALRYRYIIIINSQV
jgi:hypothetical protein